jgi:hypothetical protein
LPVTEMASIAVLDFRFSGLLKKSYKGVNNKLLIFKNNYIRILASVI